MTPKEYLSQYYWAKKEIESKRDEIQQLETIAEYVSPRTSASGSKGTDDKVGMLVAKIADEKGKLRQEVSALLAIRDKIKGHIDEIDNKRYRLVLTERYINCKQWREIAADIHYSVRAVQYFHRDALSAFGRKWPYIKTLH